MLAWDLQSLCVWHLSDGTLVNALAGQFNSAALSGGRILTAEPTVPPTVRSWPLQGGAGSLVSLQFPAGTTFDPPAAARASLIRVSPRGDTLGAATTAQDAASGELRSVLSLWSADGTFRASFPNTLDDLAYSECGAFAFAGESMLEIATNRQLFEVSRGSFISAQTVDASGTLVPRPGSPFRDEMPS